MNKLLRRILIKIAQEQPAQPETTPKPALGPAPAIPGSLFVNLNKGYNGGTVSLLAGLTNQLNTALHYASAGKGSIQDIINNNLDLSGANPDQKNVGLLSQRIFSTFLNRGQPFPDKVDANRINNWANALLTSSEYDNLSQIKPTSDLSIKLGRNLKSMILDYMNQIKQLNPVTA